MIVDATIVAATALSALAGVGVILHAIAMVRLRRHLARGATDTAGGALPRITHWRALKRGIPQLAEKLENWISAGREGDQFLIGVDAGSADLAVCEAVAAKFLGREVHVIACEPGRAENPKISKFLQMGPHARHAHWLLTDSEALTGAAFLEAFRREWADGGEAALTAGYRFEGLESLVQALDAGPALLSLWPGLMLAGRRDFTLGACTAMAAADVQEAGGWQSFADELAEDRQLGAKLAARGRRIGLSREVLPLDADALGWWDWLKHQHRVAVTYRKAAPLGALGLPILHALPLALAAAIVGGAAVWWPVVAGVYLARLVIAARMARWLKFRVPLLPFVVLLVPLLETVFWLLAWLPLPVWWAGKWRWLR